jgi:hypothetical protein
MSKYRQHNGQITVVCRSTDNTMAKDILLLFGHCVVCTSTYYFYLAIVLSVLRNGQIKVKLIYTKNQTENQRLSNMNPTKNGGEHRCSKRISHHLYCEIESRSWRGVQHYVIKFVSGLRQVGGFLRALRFPPPI